MTAKTTSWKSLVNIAEKGKKDTKEPSYEFSKRTFKKTPAKPGQHVKTYP